MASYTPQPSFPDQGVDDTASHAATKGKSRPTKGKLSRFIEHDIDGLITPVAPSSRPARRVRFRSKDDVFEQISDTASDDASEPTSPSPGFAQYNRQAEGAGLSRSQPSWTTSLTIYFPYAVLFTLLLALIQKSPLVGSSGISRLGVEGGAIPIERAGETSRRNLAARADTPTDICTRWSHQTAIVNGTLYIYGGRSKEESSQTSDTWNNDFLTLDVTKSWDISAPAMKGLPRPSGPPPVANGYIWNSYKSLFLYGGEYSDNPVTSPEPYSLWEFDIGASKWTEHSSPKTSAGKASDDGNKAVQQAAEGAGISVPSLGRGWYFGGHLDGYTTSGWSQSIARVYLKSMIEFTFPGLKNSALDSLKDDKAAGEDGAWRNITQGGLQESKGFTERADGVLVYVPGFGSDGIILGLGGGTNKSFTQMNVIDVYDVANSTWYKQSTRDGPPDIRVNPCAVAASAPDGSSTNIYLYGGQNLIPADEQTQYDDMWILTVPSFTWIKVDAKDGNPTARAGHSCEVWDGQMIVVGGYVGEDSLSCDSPGIYVFNLTSLEWQTSFNALEGSNDQSQQASQSGDKIGSKAGLSGSYGYKVPKVVQDVVGGDGRGSATVTAPAVSAAAGPLKTGAAVTYTVTADGATVTQTSGAGSSASGGSAGPNVGAIVAGVVAGLFAILAAYLGFCAYVYRRQLNLYKDHVAASQRAALAPPGDDAGFLAAGAEKSSGLSSSQDPNSSSANNNPSSGSSAARGSTGIPLHSDDPRPSDANSDDGEIYLNQEPSFIGVMMSPRKSLRVINRD